MEILIAINDNYLEAAKTMLFSLSCHHKEIIVHLIYNDLTYASRSDLELFLTRSCQAQVFFYYLDNSFSDAPTSEKWPKEIYYRLLAFSILPNNLEKILWLDADIIINNNISCLYDTKFNDAYAVVCRGCNQKLKYNIGLPDDHIYFNSGVILFNLSKIRSDFQPKHFFDCIEMNKGNLTAPDQDILNIMFANHVIYKDEKVFNCETYGDYVISHKEIDNLRKNARIIHFTGPTKPWNPKGANWADSFWWKYEKKRGRIKEWLVYRFQNFPIKLYYNFRELFYCIYALIKKTKV